jgi:hypothetical protein
MPAVEKWTVKVDTSIDYVNLVSLGTMELRGEAGHI